MCSKRRQISAHAGRLFFFPFGARYFIGLSPCGGGCGGEYDGDDNAATFDVRRQRRRFERRELSPARDPPRARRGHIRSPAPDSAPRLGAAADGDNVGTSYLSPLLPLTACCSGVATFSRFVLLLARLGCAPLRAPYQRRRSRRLLPALACRRRLRRHPENGRFRFNFLSLPPLLL